VILVVSEGAVTEPEYIEGFADACHNSRVRVKTEEGVGVPRSVVEVAKKMKKEADRRAVAEEDDNLRFDEVWCVFDVDDHPDVANSKQMAIDNGIDLAISNPCVELWLWLHFADQPGMQHRHAMQHKLKEHVPGFDKHVKYADYAAGYEAAWKRAKQLETAAKAAGEADRNPSTGVWRLTESIRKGS
jgi:hypothetical protein